MAQFDPLLAFDRAAATFKQSNIVLPGEPETPSVQLPAPPPFEDQFQADLNETVAEIGGDLAERIKEYAICQQRGHTPTDRPNDLFPGLQLCKHCGTSYKIVETYEEYGTPAETAQMLEVMKQAQLKRV